MRNSKFMMFCRNYKFIRYLEIAFSLSHYIFNIMFLLIQVLQKRINSSNFETSPILSSQCFLIHIFIREKKWIHLYHKNFFVFRNKHMFWLSKRYDSLPTQKNSIKTRHLVLFLTKYLRKIHYHMNVTRNKSNIRPMTKKQLVKCWEHQFYKRNNLYLHDVRTRCIKTTPDHPHCASVACRQMSSFYDEPGHTL
jgi:hypothetical protein